MQTAQAGEFVQQAEEELLGRPLANMVRYAMYGNSVAALNINEITNELSQAYADVDEAEKQLEHTKPPAELSRKLTRMLHSGELKMKH
jgi:hypothetical protein